MRRPLSVERFEARLLLTGGPVAPSQTVPTAHDDVIDTDEGNPVTIPVLDNDSDPSGITFSSVAVGTQPAHGAIAKIDPETGQITYSPAALFAGTDTFTYTFRDKFGLMSNAANVTVIVNRPVANDDFATTVSGVPVHIDAAGNDADPDGNDHLVPGSVAIVTGPAHGSASLGGDGGVTYTPAAGFEGTDHLLYTIKDKAGATSNAGTITIAVTAPPAQAGTILNDDAVDTDAGNPVTVAVLANDVSPIGFDATTVALASQPAHGQAKLDASGSITYTPAEQYFGTDTFSYTVKDKNGGIAGPARVSIVVNRPTANDNFAETFGTTPVTIDLLENDTDPDGADKLDPSSVRLVSLPAHGLATFSADGQVVYTAAGGFSGTDRFTYIVRDKAGATSNIATVTVVTDLGQISGTVFGDFNADGTQNAGEIGIAGRVFYLDANNDGKRDATETASSSDADGRYTFKGLPAGSYVVRQDAGGSPNLIRTGPAGGAYQVAVGDKTPVAVGPGVGNITFTPIVPVKITAQPFPQGPADTATKFVQGLYRGVVGRDVSPSDVAATVNRLERSATLRARTAAARGVWESAEHRRATIATDYQTILGRAPSSGELSKLTRQFAAKGGEVSVAASLLGSAEFRAKAGGGNAGYVAALYQQVLGRAPTADESSSLTSKLDRRRISATSAAEQVLTSTEGAGLIVDSLFTAILQHPADSAQRDALALRVARGRASVESIGVSLLASDETYSRAAMAAKRG